MPDPIFFEAAIDTVCGPQCEEGHQCLSAVGKTIDVTNPVFLANFDCEHAKAGNSSIDCEPNNWEGGNPPYWLASAIAFNIGIKQIGSANCRWRVDEESCRANLMNTLTDCPGAGVDWNNCMAWTVGAGPAQMTVDEWKAVDIPE